MTIYELFIQDLSTDRRLEVPVHGIGHSVDLLQRMDEIVADGEAEHCPGWPPTIRFGSLATLRRMIKSERGLTMGVEGDPSPGRQISIEAVVALFRDGGPFEASHYEV